MLVEWELRWRAVEVGGGKQSLGLGENGGQEQGEIEDS
jgi:hypothetical protein